MKNENSTYSSDATVAPHEIYFIKTGFPEKQLWLENQKYIFSIDPDNDDYLNLSENSRGKIPAV